MVGPCGRVPWSVGIPPEVTTEYVGVKLGDYYRDPEVMLRTQLEAREIFYRLYGLPKGGVSPTYSSYVEASQFGVEVLFPEDNVPMVKGPVMRDAKEVYKLKVTDPRRGGLMARAIKTYEYMRKKVGDSGERRGP